MLLRHCYDGEVGCECAAWQCDGQIVIPGMRSMALTACSTRRQLPRLARRSPATKGRFTGLTCSPRLMGNSARPVRVTRDGPRQGQALTGRPERLAGLTKLSVTDIDGDPCPRSSRVHAEGLFAIGIRPALCHYRCDGE